MLFFWSPLVSLSLRSPQYCRSNSPPSFFFSFCVILFCFISIFFFFFSSPRCKRPLDLLPVGRKAGTSPCYFRLVDETKKELKTKVAADWSARFDTVPGSHGLFRHCVHHRAEILEVLLLVIWPTPRLAPVMAGSFVSGGWLAKLQRPEPPPPPVPTPLSAKVLGKTATLFETCKLGALCLDEPGGSAACRLLIRIPPPASAASL